MKHRIFLCDTDTEYMFRIAAYVRESELRTKLEIVPYSTIEAFIEDLSRESPSLTVMNIAFQRECQSVSLAKRPFVWIGEEERKEAAEGASVASKYHPLPVMIRSWMEAIQGDHEQEEKRMHAPVVSIWSVSGGVGKTTIGSWLAGNWNRRGSSAFYLTFDAEPSVRFEREDVMYHDLSEWQYIMKCGKKVNPLALGEHSSSPDLHMFHPDTPSREFARLRRDEATAIMDVASGVAGCSCVIVDAGTGWSESSEAAWHRSDLILFVATKEPSSELKAEKWFRDWPGWKTDEPLREKMIWVWNKRLDVDRDELEETSVFHLPYVPEWKQEVGSRDPLFQYNASKLLEELWSRCMR